MKKIHKFFSKDLLHILGAVGIFVAFLISIAYKQVGIGALIAAWLIAMAIIGVPLPDTKSPMANTSAVWSWDLMLFRPSGVNSNQS